MRKMRRRMSREKEEMGGEQKWIDEVGKRGRTGK